MDFLPLAALFPLAQATENAPHPGQVAGEIFKSLISGQSLAAALLGLVVAVAIQIVASWIAAKVVVGDPKGSFANAFKVWLLYLVVGFGFVLLLGVLVPVLALANNPVGALAVFGGGFLLVLGLGFLLPMNIFKIGFLRTLGFLVLAVVLIMAANAGLLRAQGKPALGSLPLILETLRSSEKRDQLLKQLSGKGLGLEGDLDRLGLPAERAKPFPERQENLRKVYETLEARQKALPAGEAKALAEYERLRGKYEELVRVLKADYAASKAQTP